MAIRRGRAILATGAVVLVVLAFRLRYEYSEDTGLFMFQQLNRSSLFPAGMDWDEKHQRFIVGSLGEPSLFTLSPGEELQVFVTDPDVRRRNCTYLGVKVDRPRNRVLAVVTSFRSRLQHRQAQASRENTHTYAGSEQLLPSFEALAAYDLDTGARVLLARLDQDVPSGSGIPQASGIAVDTDGNAYVTNPVDNYIWKVTAAGVATIFTQDDLLKPAGVTGAFADKLNLIPPRIPVPDDPTTWGLNAIVYHPEEHHLTVIDGSSGRFLKVDIGASSTPTVQKLKQDMPSWFRGSLSIAFDQDRDVVAMARNSAAQQRADVDDVWYWIAYSSSCFPVSIAVRNSTSYVVCSHLPDLLQGKSRDSFSIRYLRFAKDLSWTSNDVLLFLLCWVARVVLAPMVVAGVVVVGISSMILAMLALLLVSIAFSRVSNYHQINHA